MSAFFYFVHLVVIYIQFAFPVKCKHFNRTLRKLWLFARAAQVLNAVVWFSFTSKISFKYHATVKFCHTTPSYQCLHLVTMLSCSYMKQRARLESSHGRFSSAGYHQGATSEVSIYSLKKGAIGSFVWLINARKTFLTLEENGEKKHFANCIPHPRAVVMGHKCGVILTRLKVWKSYWPYYKCTPDRVYDFGSRQIACRVN